VLTIGEKKLVSFSEDDRLSLTLLQPHLGTAPITSGGVAFVAHKRVSVDHYFWLATLAGNEDHVFYLLAHSGEIWGDGWSAGLFCGCKTRNEN
jgi:hypothetical protein